MILIEGKKIAAELRDQLKKEVADLKVKTNKDPGLTVILIGELAPSKIYVKMKEKAAIEVGIKSEIIRYPADPLNPDKYRLFSGVDTSRASNPSVRILFRKSSIFLLNFIFYLLFQNIMRDIQLQIRSHANPIQQFVLQI